MKNFLPYILLVVILAGIIMLMMSDSKEQKKGRNFNGLITLRKEHKIPYGLYVAYNSLSKIFPRATVSASRREPGFWDSLSNYEKKQAVIIIAEKFSPDEEEIKRLVNFAAYGNDVFISARSLSVSAESAFHCSVFERADWIVRDSLEMRLDQPPFHPPLRFSYPGAEYASYLSRYDTIITDVLGRNRFDKPVFTRFRTGEGTIYLHLAPLAFSNYFLLHKQNMRYYENVISVIPADTKKIVWDEYYRNKPWNSFGDNNQGSRNNWWSVMMGIPPLRAALWTGMITLLIYLLLGMRRKQRIIPVIEKPKNESLDFAKTIGRLYFDKNDHVNLCAKMSNYFLEHVRSHYRISTTNLDEGFVKNLHHKSGYSEEELRDITRFIMHLSTTSQVSDQQLAAFYKKLESFYKNT